ncbi:Transcription factor atf1 [Erysiphe necator]|uniref:Putative bzip transcription factor n=1 Tax=Uncinula necator TaxID=52586 RepID=A0A0B1P1E3_UNCNE|nr:Transcription factor atf1 [Erysiphe necator]KHJ32053.1 putative bzip transcription factor [Erysiphe necator]
MVSSPTVSTAADVTSPISSKRESPKQNNLIRKPDDIKSEKKESLAPPPRLGQPSVQSADYFSSSHSHLASEANPFDFSFAGGSSGNTNGGNIQTPGGTRLPPVSNLTSPAGILGPGITGAYWGANSLRSGPVSPAMIGGPQKPADDYFVDGHHIRDLRSGFITANESALRSGFTPEAESNVRAGLTPGGSGTMFPELVANPPTSIYNSMTNAAQTPSTIEFHRVAINAQKRNQPPQQSNTTSQPQEHVNAIDVKPVPCNFDDANAAASGLFLLAQSRESSQSNNQYALTNNQLPIHAHPVIKKNDKDDKSTENSPVLQHRKGLSISNSSRGDDSASENDVNKSQLRDQSKKSSPGTSGRRKASEVSTKASSSKKAKINNATSQVTENPTSEDDTGNNSEHGTDGKKITDEEKRKNFLERNRIAALKCRQRKKQWLNSLQAKVEVYASENEGLNAQIQALRDEIVHIKTLLLAHKECPVSVAQGISGMNMHQLMNEGGFTAPINPYGINATLNHQQSQQHVVNGRNLQQRRYS